MILAQYKSNIQDFTALKLSDGYSSPPMSFSLSIEPVS